MIVSLALLISCCEFLDMVKQHGKKGDCFLEIVYLLLKYVVSYNDFNDTTVLGWVAC